MRQPALFLHMYIQAFFLRLLLLFCCGFLLSACQKQPESQSNSVAPITVIDMIPQDLAPVKLGHAVQKTAFTGTIRAVNQSSIQAQVSATVTQINAQIGQKVQKGQWLVKLNNQDNTARLAQAQANLSAAQAQVNLAKNMMQRKLRLLNQGFIARVDYEQSQVDYQAQLENVNVQQANVNIAQKANQDGVILSPISGIISQRQVEIGQTVAIGQSLFEIIDPNHLELQAKLPTDAQQALQVGYPIEYTIQGQRTLFTATLSRVAPLADMSNRQIEFFATPKEQIPPLSIGAFVDGYILTSQGVQGQIIPLDSIQDLKTKPYVWIVRNRKIQRINVTVLEQRNNDNIGIVQGLHPSDQVSRIPLNSADLNKTVNISQP